MPMATRASTTRSSPASTPSSMPAWPPTRRSSSLSSTTPGSTWISTMTTISSPPAPERHRAGEPRQGKSDRPQAAPDLPARRPRRACRCCSGPTPGSIRTATMAGSSPRWSQWGMTPLQAIQAATTQRRRSARPQADVGVDRARPLRRHRRGRRRSDPRRDVARACRCGDQGRHAGERRRRPPPMSATSHNNRTLLIAFGANLGIAVSKFVAAAITGSSAMLTEGVHSVVDSTNQLLLIWGRRQARKPADKHHPLGYGRELYFWSFVVAVLVFSLGAGVSIYEGIIHIARPRGSGLAADRLRRPARRFRAGGLVDAGGVSRLQGRQGRARLDRGDPPLEGSAGLHRPARKWRGDGRDHRRRDRPVARRS